MAFNNQVITLNNGNKIPQVGLGTWQNKNSEATVNSVYQAIKTGYRHIDTAAIYGNEREVGIAIKKAIAEGIVKREDLFVTTKLWCTQHRLPQEAIKQSLERLQLDYVDLYLMHMPVAFKSRTFDQSNPENFLCVPINPDNKSLTDVDVDSSFVDTYIAMQNLKNEGLAKSIGVSNFSIKNLKELFKHPLLKIMPSVNQIEIHPLLPQDELIEFCKEHDIVCEAFSPMGSNDSTIFTNKTLASIAEKLNVDVAQVCISWAIQRGYVVLPKSSQVERIERNFKNLAKLSDEDFAAVSSLKEKYGEQRFVCPDLSPFKIYE